MIDSWSEKIAVSIKQANVRETASVEVMAFALTILFNFAIPVIVSLLIGLLTGALPETALSVAAFVVLRMLSGGYHFRSPVPCMLAMIAITATPPHIRLPEEWTFILTAAALTLAICLAPSNMRGYNTMPAKYYPLLKAASVVLVCGNFALASQTAALVFVVQGVSLFKWKEV